MDKRWEQRLVEEHLNRLLEKGTIEEIGYCKRFIEYYEIKGFDVNYYKNRQVYREILFSKINLN